ncbi:hypothetical protein HPB48_010942 [Haemaphysalis longicornis]|uniref:Leucine-rich repeat and WD repeat-containing protein 1 LRR domain-containing protein n=1 Tax=Haemaphysalis longicornis TaxID=44386 RepID=A0A9J6GNA3_HAELO|nr:hypothetical protein HPB48_010942 [Haemaphysalis longicornis]
MEPVNRIFSVFIFLSLSLSNRDLKVLDPCSFKGLRNLQSLDVSRNSLRDIPDLGLPRLRCLNVEENLINDLTFLKEYSELTELMIAGNPILASGLKVLLLGFLETGQLPEH